MADSLGETALTNACLADHSESTWRTAACDGLVCNIMCGGGGAGGGAPSAWLLDVTWSVCVVEIGDPGRLVEVCAAVRGLVTAPDVEAGVAIGRMGLGECMSV